MSHSRKQSATLKEKPNEKVQVILRVRPKLANEQAENYITVEESNVIAINKPGLLSYMKFSYVQPSEHGKVNHEGQNDMFKAVHETVRSVFEGVDATIFAYGQTGAGKTYTVIGNCPQNNADFQKYHRGILPRALEVIFEEQRKKKNSRISIRFFEIYNEKIYNLLSSSIKPLDIREDQNGEITIPELPSIEVLNMKEILNYLAQGVKNRATSSTSANIKSSRSHSIFHVRYEKLVKNPDTNQNSIQVSNLRVVDLAGSEKFNISNDLSQQEKELRLLELKSINGSLSKLGHCISALTIQSRTHIPVRDSKLTRILSEALIGSGKIRLIICVSPSISAINETSSTLQFADRVKKAVFEKHLAPHLAEKQMISYEQYVKIVEELERERTKRMELEAVLEQVRATGGEINFLRENDRLRQEVIHLKQQLRLRPGKISPDSKSISPRPNHSKWAAPKTFPTPPKTSISKSVQQYEGKSQKNSTDLCRRGKKNNFETKIRAFIDNSQLDKDFEAKVKQRLGEIKRQLTHGEWDQSRKSVLDSRLQQ